MASVSSLDQDMRKLRLDRYTPAAANEVRRWIEETLGERLAPGDLMEALRDGVALCKLVNLCVSPGVKYKASNMPFVQMENISHFLKACEMAPLSLPAHDRFLTVDLFDQKDPAQVLQCIAAFSRRANQVNPSSFPDTIGAKSKGGAMSPDNTGSKRQYDITTPPKYEPQTAFNQYNKAAYSSGGRTSPTKSSLSRGGLATGGSVSSWSKPSDENNTAPAWNIHQYGYMGGASQGNQNVAFGARRQIVSQAPEVPNLAEKEKRLKEQMQQQQQQQQREADEDHRRQQEAREQEELKAQQEEARRWTEETNRLKEQEQRDKEDRVRRQEAEKQAREEREHEASMKARREQQRQVSDSRLNGQFLSHYRASQDDVPQQAQAKIQQQSTAESERIAELERQLAEAKEAAKRYEQREADQMQQQQQRKAVEPERDTKPVLPSRSEPPKSHEDDWDASERDYLKKQWEMTKKIEAEERPPRAPKMTSAEPAPARPLPDPTEPYQSGTNRTDRYLSSNPAPAPSQIRTNRPEDYSTTTEVDVENQRRLASQTKTKAGGWASKSLLEREMERERERQREWEENQKNTASIAKDVQEGSGPGQSWDVHQYGYMGGDSQNRGGTGLGTSGARRQIIGPRPPR